MKKAIDAVLNNLEMEYFYAGPRRIFGWDESEEGPWDYIVNYTPSNKRHKFIGVIRALGFKGADSFYSYKGPEGDININFFFNKEYEIQKRTYDILDNSEEHVKRFYRVSFDLNTADVMGALRAEAKAEILQEEAREAKKHAEELQKAL